jgi:hypothetical protein
MGVSCAVFQWVRSRIEAIVVLQFRVVAHQPQDRARPLMASRHRRVARTFLALRLGQADLCLAELQAVAGVGLATGDLLAGQLAVRDRIGALDALGGVAVGDRAHFQRVHLAEIRHLIE